MLAAPILYCTVMYSTCTSVRNYNITVLNICTYVLVLSTMYYSTVPMARSERKKYHFPPIRLVAISDSPRLRTQRTFQYHFFHCCLDP